MSAESASLKIGYTSLKVRNLPSFLYGFKQTDFLRSVSPIFLTLTSQGGNQGILRSASYLFKRSQKSVFAEISDRLRLICCFVGFAYPFQSFRKTERTGAGTSLVSSFMRHLQLGVANLPIKRKEQSIQKPTISDTKRL